MTREQMLSSMGISSHDFQDYIKKFLAFRGSLNSSQISVLDRAMPTAGEIAQSFGPNCSPQDVEALLQVVPPTAGVACICWMGVHAK